MWRFVTDYYDGPVQCDECEGKGYVERWEWWDQLHPEDRVE